MEPAVNPNIIRWDVVSCDELQHPASAHARVSHQLFERKACITDRRGRSDRQSRVPLDEVLPWNHIVALVASLCNDATACDKSVDVLAAETRKVSRFSYGKPIV